MEAPSGEDLSGLRFAVPSELAHDAIEAGVRAVFEQTLARIDELGGEIELGDRVEIRTLVMLKSYGRLTLGEEATLGRGVYVQCEEEITIDHHAGLAEFVSVIDSDHRPDGSDVHFLKQPLRVAPLKNAVLAGA